MTVTGPKPALNPYGGNNVWKMVLLHPSFLYIFLGKWEIGVIIYSCVRTYMEIHYIREKLSVYNFNELASQYLV